MIGFARGFASLGRGTKNDESAASLGVTRQSRSETLDAVMAPWPKKLRERQNICGSACLLKPD